MLPAVEQYRFNNYGIGVYNAPIFRRCCRLTKHWICFPFITVCNVGSCFIFNSWGGASFIKRATRKNTSNYWIHVDYFPAITAAVLSRILHHSLNIHILLLRDLNHEWCLLFVPRSEQQQQQHILLPASSTKHEMEAIAGHLPLSSALAVTKCNELYCHLGVIICYNLE